MSEGSIEYIPFRENNLSINFKIIGVDVKLSICLNNGCPLDKAKKHLIERIIAYHAATIMHDLGMRYHETKN